MTTTPSTHPLRLLLTIIAYTFRAMTGAYGVSVTGYLALQLLFTEQQFGLVALFNSFVHLLILPALVLFPVVLLMRRWELVALTIAPVFAFGVWYAPQILAHNSDIPAESQPVRVMTYNIAAYQVGLENFINLILDADADLVLIQELSNAAAETFSDQLAEAYPHQALYPHGNAILGQGVLSRYPIVEESAWRPYAYYQQRVVVDVEGVQIVVYNAHLAYPFNNNFTARRTDTDNLIALAAAETLPVIIAGDFNLTERSDDYARLTDTFTDAYVDSGGSLFGWTYAPLGNLCVDRFPLCAIARIDYVMHGEGIVATEAQVWDTSAGSDHYPVVADLHIAPRGE